MQTLKIQRENKGEKVYIDGHELTNIKNYTLKNSAENMTAEFTVTLLIITDQVEL